MSLFQAVIVGGVVSTTIVGFVLEKAESFASLAAQAYLQDENPEDLWDGLSEEEKEETFDMLQKLIKLEEEDEELTLERVMQAIESGIPFPGQKDEVGSHISTLDEVEEGVKIDKPVTATVESTKKPTDLFSDYGD